MEIWKVPSGRNRSGPTPLCPTSCAPGNPRWESPRSEAEPSCETPRTAVIRLVRLMATTTAAFRKSDGNRGCGVCVGCFITNMARFGWPISASVHVESTVCWCRPLVCDCTVAQLVVQLGRGRTRLALNSVELTRSSMLGRLRRAMARAFEKKTTRDGLCQRRGPHPSNSEVGFNSQVRYG